MWTALFGFLFGVICDWLFKDHFLSYLRRIDHRLRRRAIRKTRKLQGDTILFGNKDTYVCAIDGDGISQFQTSNIICDLEPEEVSVPDKIACKIAQIEKEEMTKKEAGEAYAWNGKMAHIRKFNVTRTSDTEDNIIELKIQVTQYYHFMATTLVIYKEFQELGFDSPARRRFIGKFNKWRVKPPRDLVHGLPVNLVILTDDDQLVFSRRSKNVAIAPNVVSAAVNENIHPDHDYLGAGSRLDVDNFLKRALIQEVGWKDYEHSGDPDDPKADIRILAFVVDTGGVCYGLLGYAKLPITYAELKGCFNNFCKDRLEIDKLINVPFKLKEVCRFIHENELYNVVGVTVLYTMIHNRWNCARIDAEFAGLQGP